jgi:hypothetical protein
LIPHAFDRHLFVGESIGDARALGQFTLEILRAASGEQAPIWRGVRRLAHVAFSFLFLFRESSFRAGDGVVDAATMRLVVVIVFTNICFFFRPRVFGVLMEKQTLMIFQENKKLMQHSTS